MLMIAIDRLSLPLQPPRHGIDFKGIANRGRNKTHIVDSGVNCGNFAAPGGMESAAMPGFSGEFGRVREIRGIRMRPSKNPGSRLEILGSGRPVSQQPRRAFLPWSKERLGNALSGGYLVTPAGEEALRRRK
jgi:hypothetical protein